MKKLPMLVSLLFMFLMVLLTPIVAAAVAPEAQDKTGGGGWFAFALVLAGILFIWVAYKANGKIKKWLEEHRPK